MSLDFRIRRALLGLSFDESLWNPVWLSPMSPDLIRQAFEEPLAEEDLYSEVLEAWRGSAHLSLTDRTLEFFTRLKPKTTEAALKIRGVGEQKASRWLSDFLTVIQKHSK